MINEVINAVGAPFMSQVGAQGVAYGLLGFKTMKKFVTFAKDEFGGPSPSEKSD